MPLPSNHTNPSQKVKELPKKHHIHLQINHFSHYNLPNKPLTHRHIYLNPFQ
ncbi:MetQ/NlpA family ABC transporter substrate-binding protein, partial [Staphylococcus epidermidis]|uniref:MetQ/NlpA family ABC transporter substrate-binding protein n=1 Tax=Staphylococcus epidermidis TaxID=1282 RepID=UPI0037DA2EE4